MMLLRSMLGMMHATHICQNNNTSNWQFTWSLATMALKPTIYKFKIALNDFNHDYYTSLQLTVAQHPSENVERMMARLMAFCIHKSQDKQDLMTFTKGLSSVDEPDIWLKSLDDQLQLWIDMGEPSFERIKKASRLADQTLIYSFNSKSGVWWKQSQAQLATLPISVFQLDWEAIKALSENISRTMDITLTITGQTIYIVIDDKQIELNWLTLQAHESND